jgi:preprotein translocase subunit SecE
MKLVAYLKDTYNELMNKVTWPTWEELQESAILVMIASAIFAIVVALLDLAFKNALKEIYDILF